MEVKDSLNIGELSKGTVVAGAEGINRKISSIEVMEVPEVISWISEGILVMTAFYSIRDEPEKQIEVVQTLINKEAAGIVVKLGRFVDELPEQIIELANQHAFPVIVIPKDISYINVLTPLYERLYEEKNMAADQLKNPFKEFEATEFTSVLDAIDYLSELGNSPVYIEDIEGRILYSSSQFLADKWRKSNLLFSQPIYPSYKQKLEEWVEAFQTKSFTRLMIEGQKERLVLPLVSNKSVFAVVHLLYKKEELFNAVSPKYIKELGNKLSQMILNEQLLHQRERLRDLEVLGSFNDISEFNNQAIVMQFKSEVTNANIHPPNSFLDYSSFYRKKLEKFARQAEGFQTVIFEKKHIYYAVFLGEDGSYQSLVRKMNVVIHEYNDKFPEDSFHISISHPFEDLDLLDEKIRSVTKTMDIGLKIQPEEFVYSYDKLGIYEILFNLTSDSAVLKYTSDVLGSLSGTDEELFKSLQVYLNENGNVSQSATKLFIHRRTMTYRLQKIQELLTMDLDNAEHRFILQFCIKIKELK
ncbi:PucR family transcriptional regulator [Planomicrobium sp. CPCC 101079]|uniref:PucR family transcriptional regulator n=1 Tax=Planomicrobium sp. CPCC 101079 TaxID=2599618 RepID=UPI0011B5A8D1|nr:PucR family transcriptional regulator [Planomicrobium sp. CPCC 101079]TWT03637.1 hypothetical protein FQV28_11500 [Planomicrobium sp. CPCC 101079]